jgi:aldose 1-epimerase
MTGDRWLLSSPRGIELSVLAYGATLQEVVVPDRDGGRANVVLGFETVAEYQAHGDAYFGATIGRYANRIADGRFTLDNRTYSLPRNDRGNCLHGGPRGFDKRTWRRRAADECSVTLGYVSADGEMGFPGRMDVEVAYALRETELRIDFRATSDAPTVVNLTNHTCWNLSGADAAVPESARAHLLELEASTYTPVDDTGVPSGEMISVDGTSVDFRAPHPIGGADLDHNVVLDAAEGLRRAARLSDPDTGRSLEVWTTEPCLQVWTGGALAAPYGPRCCIALETQHAPDSPNQPRFPSTVLRPGNLFTSTTVYRFGGSRVAAPRPGQ